MKKEISKQSGKSSIKKIKLETQTGIINALIKFVNKRNKILNKTSERLKAFNMENLCNWEECIKKS